MCKAFIISSFLVKVNKQSNLSRYHFFFANYLANQNKMDYAKEIINSWSAAEWFTSKPPIPQEIKCIAFKIDGETNTDDLSPAVDAWSRPDIPLHSLSMLKTPREDIEPDLSLIHI